VDPVYLSWKAKEFDFHTRFIELAAEINSNMPYYVVSKLLRLLHGKPLNKCKVLLLGAAFKKDISDMRNSPSLKVMELLKAEDVNFIYNDPHVPTLDGMRSTKLTEKLLKSMDAVVILTEHSDYDYEWIVANSMPQKKYQSTGIE
jgi:UDP-N-acetyl-D-glucosamine dehydrogenase